MKKQFLNIITVFALAGLLFLIGCSTDNNDNDVRGEIINKTALQGKIAEARAERDITVKATDAVQVPLGKFWVVERVMIAFENAITSAENTFVSASSQSAVNSAVTILDNALTIFKNTRRPGMANPIDTTALNAKIALAESLKSGVVANDNAANVAQGAYRVTQSIMNNFEAAITTAKNIRDTAVVQVDVDSAIIPLNTAITTFTTARRQDGYKTSGFSNDEMTALIAMANTAKTGVKINTNGNDVGPAEFWVLSQSSLDALNTAIATAQAASAQDSAYLALVTAINNFNNAKQQGTLPNKTVLFDAIRSANEARADVVVAVSASEAPDGRYWATPAQWTPFNTAYNNALAAASNANATQNAVTGALTNLSAATIAFLQVKQINGLGTKRNSVTINGLNSSTFPNGTDIDVSLFLTNEYDLVSTPQIRGTGTINNETVKIDLYETSGFTSWAGTGTWYVGFTVDRNNPRYYISRSAVNFGTTPQADINFSGFKKYVFSAKLSTIAEWVFTSTQTMTMDQWFTRVTGMSYTEYLGYGESPFYKNEALTQPFGGSDTVNVNTVIYSEYPIDIFNRGDKIGEITGTITLTGISSPPPGVSIWAYGGEDDNSWESYVSSINMSDVSGSSATLNWSIPIFESNRFTPGETSFQLWVVPSGGNNGFVVDIPDSKNVSDPPNANVGSLGSISIAIITLSGTINVSYQGETVPLVRISAQSQNLSSWVYWTELSSPAANAPWSITMPAFDSPTEINFRIEGYSNDMELLFEKEINPDATKDVSDTNKSGITLTIQTITLSGTINVSYGGNPVPNVEINVFKQSEIIGSTSLTSPGVNTPWSIEILGFDSPTEINFLISGYSDNWNPLFDKIFSPDPPITVSNQDRSGISLNAVIQTITLSGTLNVSYGGELVPRVSIGILAQDQWVDTISLSSPGENAPWSITIPAFDSPTEISFRIFGYLDNWYELFVEDFSLPSPIIVSNQNREDISLNVGNITNPSFNPVNVKTLSANTWVNGNLTDPDTADWYSIQVSAGQHYYIWWNDSHQGNDTKTADVMVSAFYSNGVEIFDEDNGWVEPQQFYAEANGTIYIRVYPYRTSDIGTYGIAYNTSNSMPVP
jgi:hypothetical protein